MTASPQEPAPETAESAGDDTAAPAVLDDRDEAQSIKDEAARADDSTAG